LLKHTPEQHSADVAHSAPVAAHWHLPLAQLPEQQSLPAAQSAPAAAHAQSPAEQLPLQQSAPAPHARPAVEQAHVPFTHEPEQQSASPEQTDPTAEHAHAPAVHTPAQQSDVAVQARPAPPQHRRFSQTPVQQSGVAVQSMPGLLHVGGAAAHVSMQVVGSLGSEHFSSIPPPQQTEASSLVAKPPFGMQAQTPAVQMSDAQPTSRAQAAPTGSGPHMPLLQPAAFAHWSSAVHGEPFAFCSWQVPSKQSCVVHWASSLHAPPFITIIWHVPTMQ
jgi:hypothetical protein